ncbi:fumarate hydratase [Candidatus Omnitrophota bacterium]
MRQIDASRIKNTVSDLCVKANTVLRPDILKAIRAAYRKERNKRPREILKFLIENAELAKKRRLAICQDTGMAVVFLKIGQGVRVKGRGLIRAVNDGVKAGYRAGRLRKSVVGDPIKRMNTSTNTPCIIYTEIVKGDRLTVTVLPKGFGSENKSALKMLNPADGLEEIGRFVMDVVKKAGPGACPPFVVGVGIGGTFDSVCVLAKRALMRPIGLNNKKRHFAKFERALLKEINSLKLGPMGFGGRTTALGVNVEAEPTHIAGMPVAVNISCHATRGASAVI